MDLKYSRHLQFIKPLAKQLYYRSRQLFLGQGVVNANKQGLINFVDVGSVGWLPEPWFTHAKKISYLLKFEPRDGAESANFVTSIDTALWSKNEVCDFYVYKGLAGQGSSLFQQNVEYVKDNFETLKHRGLPELANTWIDRAELSHVEQIKCRRLDDVLEENPDLPPFHLLKIDAQGAEHEILQGAENLLADSCIGLHLELFTIPLYKGITLLPDVAEYLKKFDFELVKKMPAHGSFESQHDCIFLKRGIKNQMAEEIRRVYEI